MWTLEWQEDHFGRKTGLKQDPERNVARMWRTIRVQSLTQPGHGLGSLDNWTRGAAGRKELVTPHPLLGYRGRTACLRDADTRAELQFLPRSCDSHAVHPSVAA